MDIINYKLKEFLVKDEELKEDYSLILGALKPIPTKYTLFTLPLYQVDFIRRNLGADEALIQIFEYVQGITEKEILELDIVSFYGYINSVIEQVKNLNIAEEVHLTSKYPNIKWGMVDGSERLRNLGMLPMVDNLAGGDILKHDAIMELPYEKVFKKLMLDTKKADIDHEMNKIKTKTD